MGMHEYRPPTAHGGIVTAWIYREDRDWLAKQAAEGSRWLSAQGRQVRMDLADALHELVESRRAQGNLPLHPDRPVFPVFARCPPAYTRRPKKPRPSASQGT